MFELIGKFFSSGEFMPHGMCYLWQPGVLWLHIISDTLITHAMEIWVIWNPTYGLSGGIKALTALASVPTAVYAKDLQGRYLLINRRYEDLFHIVPHSTEPQR